MKLIKTSILMCLLGVSVVQPAFSYPSSYSPKAAEHVVYQVYQPLSLGNETTPVSKDYYIDMGSVHGLSRGSLLQIFRRVETYDMVRDRASRDMTFPVALVRVIHVESKTAVARLEKLFPITDVPAEMPLAIMVGDLVIPQPRK